MAKLIRDQDFISGLVFICFGLGYVLLGQNLPFGTPRRMGPAFFPFILAGILVSIGVMLALKALRKRGELVEAIALKPTLLVAAATISFALLIRSGGIIVAVVSLVLIASLASQAARPLPAAMLAAGLAAFCVGVFVSGLGLPLPVLGHWFER